MSEQTLDPRDWEEFRADAHRVLDESIDFLRTVRERAVWAPTNADLREQFRKPLPVKGEGFRQVYEEFMQSVLYHPLGNIHPRFWGWVNGTGSAQGMLADLVTAAMNSNAAGFDQVAVYVELQVLNWLKQILNYPVESSGIFVTGGSVANFIGLSVARTAGADRDILERGLQGCDRPLRFYASDQTHMSVEKSLRILGIGSSNLRKIAVNTDYQIDVEELRQAIARDREQGYRPCCVIGNAGTVNTGAFDPLDELANLCEAERLWFHVDGAFGALAALSPELRPLTKEMNRADSLAFDLHKWMYMPYDIGCVLVRNSELHKKTFAAGGSYIAPTKGGVMASGISFTDLALEQSRAFRGLKAWLLLKEHGVAKYAQLIEQNVSQANYLVSLIQQHPELEIAAPAPLNIVCFRYVNPSCDETRLDEINRELLVRLQESGIAVPSYTILNGKFVIRVAITNHRSRKEDFEALIRGALTLGRQLSS